MDRMLQRKNEVRILFILPTHKKRNSNQGLRKSLALRKQLGWFLFGTGMCWKKDLMSCHLLVELLTWICEPWIEQKKLQIKFQQLARKSSSRARLVRCMLQFCPIFKILFQRPCSWFRTVSTRFKFCVL